MGKITNSSQQRRRFIYGAITLIILEFIILYIILNLKIISDTFIGYMKNLDENSKAIINIDDPNCLPLLEHIKGETITFGINNENATYNITNIVAYYIIPKYIQEN